MKSIHAVVGTLLGAGLILLFASATPRLEIAGQGTNAVISWSATNSTNFVLQQTPALGFDWITVPKLPASDTDKFYVVVQFTNNASLFRLFLAASNIVDIPDDAFVDSNGDGIDGDVAKAIFVATSGNDSFPGTMTQPVRTIAEGVRRGTAAGKDVYVAAGVYISGTLSLSNSVSIYGGYSPTDWSRNDGFTVYVTVTNATAINANNLTNMTTLDHLTVTAGNAAGAAASAYGVFALNSPGLVIRQCSIQAGNGGSGLAGVSGLDGANGGNGGMGSPGCENSSFGCSRCNQPPGGTAGSSACGKSGGVGGLPGLGGSDGFAGGTGAGGTPGGAGAPCSGSRNCDGTPGTDGAPGADGVNGLPGSLGSFTVLGYSPTDGTDGATGGSGNGGGGGGGGGGGTANCDSYGSSGGGGGGGGCGGTGGRAGRSAGGSFAVYLWSSDARIENCTLVTGNGGNGGNGGTAGTRGIGTAGGLGGPYGGSGEQDDGGDGAPGGKGGDGGRGGHGGGGAGGPSIGIVRAGGSNPQLTSLSFTLGPGGAGGGSLGASGSDGPASNLYP